MVYTFESSSPEYQIFMGRDKFENEDLIAHAFPEDVWFHVSELSSAHVYVRMPFGCTDIQSLPEQVIQEAAQLTKQNSIAGVKAPEVSIVYTLASNLKKSGNMDIGQVGFKNQKQVFFLRHVKKDKDMIKRLEKTRQEPTVDLKQARHLRDRKEFQHRKQQQQQTLQQQQELERQRQQEQALRSYASLKATQAEEIYKGDGSIESCRTIEEDFL